MNGVSDTDNAKVGRLKTQKRLLTIYSRLFIVCKCLSSFLLLIYNTLK